LCRSVYPVKLAILALFVPALLLGAALGFWYRELSGIPLFTPPVSLAIETPPPAGAGPEQVVVAKALQAGEKPSAEELGNMIEWRADSGNLSDALALLEACPDTATRKAGLDRLSKRHRQANQAQLERLCKIAAAVPNYSHLPWWIEELAEQDYFMAARLARGHEEQAQRQSCQAAAARGYGRSRPQEALHQLEQVDTPYRAACAGEAARTWARTDLMAALSWIQAHLQTEPRAAGIAGLLDAAASRPPDEAFTPKLARELLEGLVPPWRLPAVQSVATLFAAEPAKYGAEFHAWLETLPPEELVDLVETHAEPLVAWAPKKLCKAIFSASEPAKHQRALQTCVELWAAKAPKEAAAALVGIPDSILAETAVTALLGTWMPVDLNAATAWVDSLNEGILRDFGIHELVRHSEAELPVKFSWAASLTDPFDRMALLEQVLLEWSAKDAPAAQQATTTLGEAEQRHLAKKGPR
jgi:hypothetical protein